ncbi:MAG: VanZ family protein [Roseburia sp.]
MSKRKRRLVAGILFVGYFLVLFYLLFFSEKMGRTPGMHAYRYNLTPFQEIKRFLRYQDTLGTGAVLLNIVGNVAAFVPFGAFIPVFSRRCRNFFVTMLYSFELSLFVELLQLIFKVGTFDVDDLMLNTLGGVIGFLISFLVSHFLEKAERKKCGGGDAEKKK